MGCQRSRWRRNSRLARSRVAGRSASEIAIHDPVWETIYAPIGAGIAGAADLLNVLQFLTIRRYLGFVFIALILLLLVLALWQ